MLINLFDKNCIKVMLYFALSPGKKHTRKEIKEFTGINNVPLDNSLDMLLSSKTIEENRRIYSLNFDNTLTNLIMEERKQFSGLPLKVQFALVDFVHYASKIGNVRRIFLFGSYAKLIFTDNSDIDISVILSNKLKNKLFTEKKLLIVGKNVEKRYKKSIHLSFFYEKDMKNKKDPLVKDILRNGRMLL